MKHHDIWQTRCPGGPEDPLGPNNPLGPYKYKKQTYKYTKLK